MFQISVSLQSEVVVSWAVLCWGWVGDQWSFCSGGLVAQCGKSIIIL